MYVSRGKGSQSCIIYQTQAHAFIISTKKVFYLLINLLIECAASLTLSSKKISSFQKLCGSFRRSKYPFL